MGIELARNWKRNGFQKTASRATGQGATEKNVNYCLICVKHVFTLLGMIKTFKHKGLKELFETGKSRRVAQTLKVKCIHRLDMLDASRAPENMNVPGFRFHGLHGNSKRYSVRVSGNYRITFGWEGEDAVLVDLEDYH